MDKINSWDIGDPHAERPITIDRILLEISVHLIWNYPNSNCTVVAITVTVIRFGVYSQHAGHVWTFHETSVQEVLSEVVEFIGKDSSRHSQGFICLLSHHFI